MKKLDWSSALAAAVFLLVGAILGPGCGSSGNGRPAPPPAMTGGSGGGPGGSGGSGGGPGGSGGAGGSGGSPATGGSGGTGGKVDGSGDDGPAGTPIATADAAGNGADAMSVADGGGPKGDGGAVLACWPDPKVIMICAQLLIACENCGPNKGKPFPANQKAKACFDLVDAARAGKATDADCAQHAKDNDCTVDDVATTGNVCGSLTCDSATCGGTHGTDKNSDTCLKAREWGDSSACAFWYAKCPCK